jgi:hypothetical protein
LNKFIINHGCYYYKLFSGEEGYKKVDYGISDYNFRPIVPSLYVGAGIEKAFEKGLLIETSGARDQVIKLLPPLTISTEDLRYGLSIVKDSLEAVLEAEKKPSVCFLPKMDALEFGLPVGSFASF